jgi:hypothetical protein
MILCRLKLVAMPESSCYAAPGKEERLLTAAREGDLAAVKQLLLDIRLDVNAKGTTRAIIATRVSYIESIGECVVDRTATGQAR